jgi:hypothetical protein
LLAVGPAAIFGEHRRGEIPGMILRRSGTTVSAVRPHFAAAAFNEIAFVRQPGCDMTWAGFEESHERVGEHALTATAEGRVKIEAEAALLEELLGHLTRVEAGCGPDELLLLESRPGHDYPRLHEHTDNLVEDGRNRLYFHYSLDPPLRLGVYRRRTAPAHPG